MGEDRLGLAVSKVIVYSTHSIPGGTMRSVTRKAMKVLYLLTMGAVLATIAVYLWSLLFRQVLPFKIVTSAYDEAALIRFLEVEFPQSGTYTLPAPDDSEDAANELFEAGPVATVHVLGPRDISLRTKVQTAQILQTFTTVFLIGWLLWIARPAMSSYRLRVGFVALMGIAAASYNDLADPVWAYHPLRWTLAKALYHLTAWTVAGLIMANDKFIGVEITERKQRMST